LARNITNTNQRSYRWWIR